MTEVNGRRGESGSGFKNVRCRRVDLGQVACVPWEWSIDWCARFVTFCRFDGGKYPTVLLLLDKASGGGTITLAICRFRIIFHFLSKNQMDWHGPLESLKFYILVYYSRKIMLKNDREYFFWTVIRIKWGAQTFLWGVAWMSFAAVLSAYIEMHFQKNTRLVCPYMFCTLCCCTVLYSENEKNISSTRKFWTNIATEKCWF